jgi:hypothetical protein
MRTTPIDLDPAHRNFPAFSLTRLLGTVFAPTEGCRICILTDFPEPANFRPSAYLLAALQSVRDSVPQLATA